MMAGLKRVLMWGALLCKRLYKRATFLCILLLIPLLVLGFSLLAKEESGVITIALAREQKEDPLSRQMMEELLEGDGLIRFVESASPEDAVTAVSTGKADGAWIFPEDTAGKIVTFAEHPYASSSIVRVVEREATVALRLSREKLSKTLFKCCSREYFLLYVRSHETTLREMSDEEVLSYYDNGFSNGNLFDVSYVDSTQDPQVQKDPGYLMAPLRGLLAILIVLCGLATGMYYVRDLRSGLFSWLSERWRPYGEFGYQIVSLLNVSAAVFIALFVVGLTGNILREILVLLLYCICVASFSCLLRSVCGLRGLGVVMPLLVVVMIALCPVFFDLKVQTVPRFLFPPTYYLNALHDDRFLVYMALYTVFLWICYRLVCAFPKVRNLHRKDAK